MQRVVNCLVQVKIIESSLRAARKGVTFSYKNLVQTQQPEKDFLAGFGFINPNSDETTQGDVHLGQFQSQVKTEQQECPNDKFNDVDLNLSGQEEEKLPVDDCVSSGEKKLELNETFNNYPDFLKVFQKYCEQKFIHYRIDKSVTNKEQNENFPYKWVIFTCIHSGKGK